MTTSDVLTFAGQTDVGRHRKDNQDTFISRPLWSVNDALLVVIDGVGGYAGGAEAAAVASESIEQYMATPTGDTLTMLQEAVIHANNQIVTKKYNSPELARMCCVLTAAVANVETRKLLFVHVGDTRLYRFRAGQLTKLTHDHSLVGVREDANQLTEREAMKHPRRNEILRDVGTMTHRVDDPEFLESGETDFLPGDNLLLCSDGLTDMLTRDQITDVLMQSLLPGEQITELIREANEQGGQDNITVVVAHYPATIGTTLAPPILPAETGYVETAKPSPILVKSVAPTEVAPTEVAPTEVAPT
ncbi:MAG: protein phosphatase 2C domain-containing protein, partial [Rudanella sp.]|nr:protein phosphatase 2C domain-containing protein [Rudanella sp.]